ncbi:bifunctional folylpolyglutamate synthase/dihydrofolate synthase [Cardiobacteriaceae bacterium TAE3-ERU3]|nr:bifunctional folylpolyglutamate synthase/dihydrofolate synthase [Cardiobacteriaceae bacterium TAE3-ERU3]
MGDQRTRNLAQWLRWQEESHPKSWDLGLERIGRVWQALGGRSIAEHVVIVAGTNGKGSCVRWCEALAVEHGISVATFTSPHLHDYRERIRFDGEYVDPDELVSAFEAIDTARGETTLTYFEWAALAAFYLMVQRKPQLAVLEVGLGGRLDAANLIDADAAIITRIGLDHQDWLGQDVETIACEKAGVMRARQTVALADQHPPQAIFDQAKALGAKLWTRRDVLSVRATDDGFALDVPGFSAKLPQPQQMPGVHQHGHLAACIAVLAQWFTLEPEKVAQVIRRTAHMGRLMWYKHPKHGADWLLDVAHNQDSAEVLRDFLAPLKQHYGKVWCVCGMLRDKAHQDVFAMLKDVVDQWVLCGLDGPRGYSAAQLGIAAGDAGIASAQVQTVSDSTAALQAVEYGAEQGDLVVVMGSFVTVAEVLERLNEYE